MFLTTNFENGAIPNIFLDLARYFEKEFELTFLTLEEIPEMDESVRRCRSSGFPLFSLGCKRADLLGAIFKFRKFVKASHYDLIHSHLGRADLVAALGKKKETPLVSTFHSVKRNFGRTTLIGYGITDRRVTLRTGVSQACLDSFYSNGFLKSPHQVVYNPIDETRLIPKKTREQVLTELGLFPNQKILLNIGRMVEAKGQKYLLRALDKIRKTRVDVRLVIVGSGPLENELRAEAQALGVDDIISWVPFSSSAQEYLNASDLVVFPSVWEGLGLVPIEAMFRRKPVVASRIPAVQEYFVDGSMGWLFEPENPLDLAEKIVTALDAKDWQEKVQFAFEVVQEKFQVEKIAQQYLSIYEQLTK